MSSILPLPHLGLIEVDSFLEVWHFLARFSPETRRDSDGFFNKEENRFLNFIIHTLYCRIELWCIKKSRNLLNFLLRVFTESSWPSKNQSILGRNMYVPESINFRKVRNKYKMLCHYVLAEIIIFVSWVKYYCSFDNANCSLHTVLLLTKIINIAKNWTKSYLFLSCDEFVQNCQQKLAI